MRDGQVIKRPMPRLIVDDALAPNIAAPGVDTVSVTDWLASMAPADGQSTGHKPVLADQDVLGVIVSTTTADTISADADLSALLQAAQVPMRDIGASPDVSDVLAIALALLSERYAEQQQFAAGDQRTLAQLRRQYMQVQDDYSELETWVWDNLAPKNFIVRKWPVTADTITLTSANDPLTQPLPAPVRGFIALDIHIAQSAPAGTLRMRCVRPVGPAFDGMETTLQLQEGTSGWLSVQLPKAGAGAPQDVVVELSFQPDAAKVAGIALSLAPESPFPDFCASHNGVRLSRPLALRVQRTLPRMAAQHTYDNRAGLPADGITRLVRPNDLTPASRMPYHKTKVRRMLRRYPDDPVVEPRPEQNAVLVQPSTHRPVGALITGVQVEDLRQARGIIQNSRHDTMEIAFALGVAPSGAVNSVEAALAHIGPWIHLLPAEWGEVWCDLETPISGQVDLLLITAMPNMPFNRNAEALFHGFRLTGGARPDAGAGPE